MTASPTAPCSTTPTASCCPPARPCEGYADAFDAPITKVEYSLDHGKTWITMETPDNDPTCWTYWRMDFTPENSGSYLLKIRTTCTLSDGTELVSGRDTNFLFTVE